MRVESITSLLLVVLCFVLANAQKIEYFEGGEGCGVGTEISLRSRPLDLTDTKRCALIKFTTIPGLNEGNGEPYRLEDRLRAVYGGWEKWSEWAECSQTCDAGVKKRIRICNSDQPDLYCKGSSESVRYCRIKSCPVDGQWTEWSSWNSCLSDCDLTSESRSRTCTNPAPKHGGESCPISDPRVEQRNCTDEPVCPGSWSPWMAWNNCIQTSGSCGDGFRTRSRTCDNPAPRNGGAPCNGSNQDSVKCRVSCGPPSPWANWGAWDACDPNCGPGTQYRTRQCNLQPNNEPCPLADPTIDGKQCNSDCKAGSYLMTTYWAGVWHNWEYCPNTFQVNQFRFKTTLNEGVTGIDFVCNDPGKSLIRSHYWGQGSFSQLYTCPAGFTSVKVTWQPDGGPSVDDRGVTCIDMFCPTSGQWYNPTCSANGIESQTIHCPSGAAVCGLQNKAYYDPNDNAGITNMNIECCRLPPANN